MKHSSKTALGTLTLVGTVSLTWIAIFGGVVVLAQSPEMEQKVAAIKQAQAENKKKIAQYSWQQTETISIKGDVKSTKVYRVQIGPDGQQQKTEISSEQAQQSGGREGRVKKHVVEKKSEEYKGYGQQLGALAKEYTQPDPDRITQAKQRGNVSLKPGDSGMVSVVIDSYVKPKDSVTLTFSEQSKQIVSVRVSSYLNDPKDVVTISAQFAQLPDGPNHVQNALINGESKQLTVNQQNSDYQRLK